MYSTSNNYKSKIYEGSTKHLLKIYINNVLIDNKFVLGLKQSQDLFFNDEFTLGSITAKSIELKLYKTVVPDTINQIYIVSGIEDEEVPIGYFNVDDISKEDDYTVTLKLLDNMIKFEFNYDGSELIEQQGYAEIIDILEDICTEAEVELGSTSFLNMHKHIAVYDNTVSARTYISYIAEQAGGFACIGRDGKLYIRTIGQDTIELPLKYFQTYKWGEKFLFTRVKYEDGVQLFELGDETGNTIYINQDNMFIVDQEQISNIYNQLNGLLVYGFEGSSIIDPALDIGDLLLIDNKYVIYQGSSEYAGKFKANISSKIQCKAKEETMTRTPSQKTIVRRVQSQIDQVNGQITSIIERQDGTQTQINTITQNIDTTTNKIAQVESNTNSKIEELETSINGVTNKITENGGNNLFYYSKEFWIGGEVTTTTTRDIQVGDDLSGKKLVFNFPPDVHYGERQQGQSFDLVVGNTGYSITLNIYVDTTTYDVFQDIVVKQNGTQTRIYRYDASTEEIINNYTELTLSNDFGEVTSIDDTVYAFRYIKIQETYTERELNIEEYTNTDIKNNSISGRGYIVNSGSSSQDTDNTNMAVPNGTYTVSFKYKKIGPALANASVKINDEEYSLEETNWTNFSKTIDVTTNHIKVEFIADTDNTLYIADLLGNLGTEADVWTQNPNETRTDTVKIGKGIEVRSSTTDIMLKADSDGVRVVQASNESNVVAEFTDKGTVTKELIVNKQAQISGLLFQQVDNQTWISSLL